MPGLKIYDQIMRTFSLNRQYLTMTDPHQGYKKNLTILVESEDPNLEHSRTVQDKDKSPLK